MTPPVAALGGPGTAMTPIGQILLEMGALDSQAVERARRLQSESGERLGAILYQLGFISERELAQALALQLALDFVDAPDYVEQVPTPERLSTSFLARACVIPLGVEEPGVRVAMADPLDEFAVRSLELLFKCPVIRCVGTRADIELAIERHYARGHQSAAGSIGHQHHSNNELDRADIQHLNDLAAEAPIIQFVNRLIERALEEKASDIHIEPLEGSLKVRFRVDGRLQQLEVRSPGPAAGVVSRIKVMANLNIAERRLPQDGRVKQRIDGREVDFRVSIMPVMHGENAVLRILDKRTTPLSFSRLGFSAADLDRLESMLEVPDGVVLVTGPTGSGKTTTLYAALERLNTVDRKIYTVEDPIEYELEGISQIQVQPQVGLDFASALRSILRQDPDVIMVGEMRDRETVRTAVQSALTGHKVFSTLHTNDAASSITRLLDMEVEEYLVTSTVTGIIAQRLVRVLCDECKQAYPVPPELESRLRLGGECVRGKALFRARGCAECAGRGYRGRISLVELLVMTDTIRELVLKRADAATLRKAAMRAGMASLYQDGISKVLQGVTSLEEVARATRDD